MSWRWRLVEVCSESVSLMMLGPTGPIEIGLVLALLRDYCFSHAAVRALDSRSSIIMPLIRQDRSEGGTVVSLCTHMTIWSRASAVAFSHQLM